MHNQHHHRTRKKQKNAKYAVSPDIAWRVDMAVYIVGILSLVFAFDQVRLVWVQGSVSGVSLLSWGFSIVASIVWMGYGFVHRDRGLVAINMTWVLVSSSIVVGVLIHSV